MGEKVVKVNTIMLSQACGVYAGDLLLVLCMTMASAVLSASFAIFPVCEAESRSKLVQASSCRASLLSILSMLQHAAQLHCLLW